MQKQTSLTKQFIAVVRQARKGSGPQKAEKPFRLTTKAAFLKEIDKRLQGFAASVPHVFKDVDLTKSGQKASIDDGNLEDMVPLPAKVFVNAAGQLETYAKAWGGHTIAVEYEEVRALNGFKALVGMTKGADAFLDVWLYSASGAERRNGGDNFYVTVDLKAPHDPDRFPPRIRKTEREHDNRKRKRKAFVYDPARVSKRGL